MTGSRLSRAVLSALFIIILLLFLWGLSYLMVRKESMERFKPFLDTPEEYDVIFIGNSHIVNDVFPFDLWQKYGICAYNLGGNGNTMPVTYWVMRLAFDYAKPRLVVVDVNDIELQDKVTGHTSNVHTTLDVYPISRTKIEAVQDLMNIPYVEDFDGNVIMDMRWEYLFTLGKYHSRWSELTGNDIHPEFSRTKGAHVAIDVQDSIDYDITDEMMEESGWGYVYLRNIIEECQKQDVDILLVNLPYPANETQQMSANTVQSIANEYGVNYINFVSLDQVVDYQIDLFDGNSHLNPSGSRKVTDYLGEYIRRNYDIPDRRNDADYTHWHEQYEDYVSLKNAYLQTQNDIYEALMLLHDEDYSIVCLIDPNTELYEDETVLRLFQNIGREHIYEADAYSKWADSLFPLEKLDIAAEEQSSYLLILDRKMGMQWESCENTTPQTEASFGTINCHDGVLRIDTADGEKLEADGNLDDTDVHIFVFYAKDNSFITRLDY